ncbi:hypothetical protein [Lentzea sp. CC55]|uniref:hypothetical protein n=1 Tax=Lentzea sp. CC55 TaxID=2884909 RepID=UPI001F3EEECA|nr:hypothetical protein [Lentzea sp. CC55]MCG8925376.1 hypothetical protein [Lentzea sp. CC55]
MNKEKGHHFARPYMTAYQLALKVHEVDPDLADQLDKKLGGSDGDQRDSLARYLANQLSRRIKRQGEGFPVEGAFLSNDRVEALQYTTSDGKSLTSSVSRTGKDLSLFRLRETPEPDPLRHS